jgi:hypothetical protein
MPCRQRGSSIGVVPVIIKLGSRWRSVTNVTPRPLYPLAKSPGTHFWLGLWTGVEKRNPLSTRGVQTPNLLSHSRSCIDCDILASCGCSRSVYLSHVSFSKYIQIACASFPCCLTFFYTDPTFAVKETSHESCLLFSFSCVFQ